MTKREIEIREIFKKVAEEHVEYALTTEELHPKPFNKWLATMPIEEEKENFRLGTAGDDNPYEKLKIKGGVKREDLKTQIFAILNAEWPGNERGLNTVKEEILKLINK